MYFFDPRGEAPTGAQMNSPACGAERGDRTVEGAVRGQCLRKDLPWDGVNDSTQSEAALVPEAAPFVEISRVPKLSTAVQATLRGGQGWPAQGPAEVSQEIQRQNATKLATSPGPKKRIGRGECVARGLSETERCDELGAESCDRGSEHTISQSGIVPTRKKGLKHRAGPGIQWRLSGGGGFGNNFGNKNIRERS
jgi:hypothetical protein